MIYYTSDWHLGDDRIGIDGKPNLFYRPFSSVAEQDKTILDNFTSQFKDGDTLYHLGDVFYGEITLERMKPLLEIKRKYPNSKFILIIGNYDEGDLRLQKLGLFFDFMYKSNSIGGTYLNHYPVNCKGHGRSITGHIHGLWKVQKEMINVGVDAWHFKLVSQHEIDFCFNAMEKFYDENVFPYEY